MTKCALLTPEYISLKLELLGIKETELAYFAGLLDSEGNLDFRVTQRAGGFKCLSAGITISNTDKKVLEWCQDKFGGDIYTHTLDNYYLVFNWQLRKREPINFVLTAIMPYLRIKKKQAEINRKGLMLITSNNGTRKGVVRSHSNIRKPPEYWQRLEEIENELKKAKHDYKQPTRGYICKSQYRGPDNRESNH